MRIKKLLLSLLALLAIPCVLTSCSSLFHQAEPTVSETQTPSITKDDIDYGDTIFMNSIYDDSSEGQFENYNCSFLLENPTEDVRKVSFELSYQAEGGKEYAKLYCDWSLERLFTIKIEEYATKFKEKGEEYYSLSSEEASEMLNNCLEEIEPLVYDNPDLVPVCMYITLKNHVKNIIVKSIIFVYY